MNKTNKTIAEKILERVSDVDGNSLERSGVPAWRLADRVGFDDPEDRDRTNFSDGSCLYFDAQGGVYSEFDWHTEY